MSALCQNEYSVHYVSSWTQPPLDTVHKCDFTCHCQHTIHNVMLSCLAAEDPKGLKTLWVNYPIELPG